MAYYEDLEEYNKRIKDVIAKAEPPEYNPNGYTRAEPTGDKTHPFTCPFCQSGAHGARDSDSAFSIKVSEKDHKYKYRCFSCGRTGDVFNFVGEMYGLIPSDPEDEAEQKAVFKKQIARIDQILGLKGKAKGSSAVSGENQSKGQSEADAEAYRNYIKACHKLLTLPKPEQLPNEDSATTIEKEDLYRRKIQGAAYLTGRGLTPETIERFKIGFDDKTTKYKDLQSVRPKSMKLVQPSIIIPYNRDLNYCIARAALSDVPERERFRKPTETTEPLFNPEALTECEVCFICESQLDAVSIYQAQANAIKSGLTESEIAGAVAIGGQGKQALKDAIDQADGITVERFIISLDNENNKNVENTKRDLAEYLDEKGFIYTFVDYQREKYDKQTKTGIKDFNQFLTDEKDNIYSVISDNVTTARNTEPPTPPQALNQILIDFDDTIRNRRIISTGFNNLDRILATNDHQQGRSGIETGITLLLGNSSIGKSTFLLNLAYNIAKNGERVIYLSYEMRTAELTAKLISNRTFDASDSSDRKGVEAGLILDASAYDNFSEKEKESIAQAKRQLSDIDTLEIYDNAPTMDEIRGILERGRRLHRGEPSPLIFVDFLQAMPVTDAKKGPRETTDEYLKFFRNISAQYDTPVVLLTSIARAHYNEPITMECGKESGNLEYYADTVLGLQALEVLEDDNPGFSSSDIEATHKAAALKYHKSQYPRRVKIKTVKKRIGRTEQECYFEYYCDFDRFEENGFNGFIVDGKTEVYESDLVKKIYNGEPPKPRGKGSARTESNQKSSFSKKK